MTCQSQPYGGAASAVAASVNRLLLAGLFCLFAGCDFESRVATGNEQGVLHYALGGEPQSLDPHVASASPDFVLISALLEPLVRVDVATLALKPGVAESWHFDQDGYRATFHLRKSARWSNGDPVRASDFVFAWRRALNPSMGNQLAEVLFPVRNAERIYSAQIDDPRALGVRALDAHTLEVALEFPYPPELFLRNMSHPVTAPLHQATLRQHDAVDVRYSGWAKPGAYVGNGPYRLERWRLQRDLRLTRNPHYWDPVEDGIKAVAFHPVDKMTTQEKLFRSGQLHVTTSLPPAKVDVYREASETPFIEQPVTRTQYLAVNMEKPLLADVRIRRALALAIDRSALVRPVYNGTATPNGRYITHGLPGYRPPALQVEYDPARARSLLAEAGYPGGAGMPPIELLVPGSEAGRAFATAAGQMWRAELNIEVDAVSQEFQVYLNTLVGGQFDLAYAGWNGGGSPNGFLDRWVSDGATNDSRFSSAAYDRLIMEEARSTNSMQALMEIYRRAESLLLSELPIIPLFQMHSTYLMQPSVGNMPANTVEAIDFKHAMLEQIPVWEVTVARH